MADTPYMLNDFTFQSEYAPEELQAEIHSFALDVPADKIESLEMYGFQLIETRLLNTGSSNPGEIYTYRITMGDYDGLHLAVEYLAAFISQVILPETSAFIEEMDVKMGAKFLIIGGAVYALHKEPFIDTSIEDILKERKIDPPRKLN